MGHRRAAHRERAADPGQRPAPRPGQPGAVLPDRARGWRLRHPRRQHRGLAVRHPRPEPGHRVRRDDALHGRDRHVRRAGPLRPGVSERAVHDVQGPARAGRGHRRDLPGQPAHAGAAGRARRRACGWRDPRADAHRPAPQQRAAPHGRPGGGQGAVGAVHGLLADHRAGRVPAVQRRSRRRRLPRSAPVLRRRRAELPLRRPQGEHRLLHQRGGADPRGPAGREGRREPAVPAARRHRRERVAPGPEPAASPVGAVRDRAVPRDAADGQPAGRVRRVVEQRSDREHLRQRRPQPGPPWRWHLLPRLRPQRVPGRPRHRHGAGGCPQGSDHGGRRREHAGGHDHHRRSVLHPDHHGGAGPRPEQLHAGAGSAGEGPAHRRGGRPARPVEPHLPDRHPRGVRRRRPRRPARHPVAAGGRPQRGGHDLRRCGAAGSPSTCSTSTCSRSRRSCRCPGMPRRRRR